LVSSEQTNVHRPATLKLYLYAITSKRTNCASTSNREWRANALRTMAYHIQGTTALARANHCTISAHDDRRFLFGNRLDGVAQVLLMVQAHIRHDRNTAIPGMRRIEPAAKPNLNDRRSDLSLVQRRKDGADEDLELGRWPDARLNLVGGIEGARNRLRKRQRGEWLSVDLHSLAVANEVRLRRGCVANPRRAEGRRDEGDDTPLAVGSGDECATNPRFRRSECAQEGI
jgi:hypothetical protein